MCALSKCKIRVFLGINFKFFFIFLQKYPTHFKYFIRKYENFFDSHFNQFYY